MSAFVIIIYVLLCLLSGYFGRDSRMGFWGCVFLSAILSPVLMLPALFLLGGGRRPA
ncbi:hypothetical protein ACQR10_07515 [Bradyrhizobium sp. HKCCYLRH2060]|uniref:hypothetical protein n=1 Tax=Bradyrhizobium TaxID=374 RepID=UPI0028F05B64|nr:MULTISPECIES: hypothetical protein [unclassified Bradyrhizobium]